MARTLTGSIKAALGLLYAGDLDLGSNRAQLPFADELAIGSGTGAGQANLAWWDSRSLAASTTEDLDLVAALTDPLGGAMTFAKLNGIYVKAHSTNGGNIEVGGDAASVGFLKAVNDIVVLAPGQVFLLTNLTAAGWTVTATTADIIQVANTDGANAGGYDIALIGRTA